VESRFFLDVVIGESSTVFELFTSEDKSLLIWWDTFFILDLSFDVFNGVSWFNIKSDGLSCEGFDENLHLCFLFALFLKLIINEKLILALFIITLN